MKRRAEYVPPEIRAALDKLSKADLMEIAYDLAVRVAGEDQGPMKAYVELRETHGILAGWARRAPVKLPLHSEEG